MDLKHSIFTNIKEFSIIITINRTNMYYDIEYYEKLYAIRMDIIKKYNISTFHLLESLKNTIYTNETNCETSLLTFFNKNYVFIVIGEQCMIVPKLCAIRWGYFEAIIERWTECISHTQVIDITTLLIDSNILKDVSYKHYAKDILKCLYESRMCRIYCWSKKQSEYYKPLLDLLIPPKDYWEYSPPVSNYNFGFWNPATTLFTPSAVENQDELTEPNPEENLLNDPENPQTTAVVAPGATTD